MQTINLVLLPFVLFCYRNVPEHERLVSLRGSVIDYTYGGGSSPAVLLVMDRLHRDLYTALRAGLEWTSRSGNSRFLCSWE